MQEDILLLETASYDHPILIPSSLKLSCMVCLKVDLRFAAVVINLS